LDLALDFLLDRSEKLRRYGGFQFSLGECRRIDPTDFCGYCELHDPGTHTTMTKGRKVCAVMAGLTNLTAAMTMLNVRFTQSAPNAGICCMNHVLR
jgi:hypothetical protein